MVLTKKWKQWGICYISDMTNGYFLVRCAYVEMLGAVLFEGPWSVNGMVFHLSYWHEHFQPVFANLSKAAIWLQLHHLPVEYRDGDLLETVTEHIGTLLKIDDHTLLLDWTKFAQVCLEIDFLQPLKRGF